jgi:ABC-type Mn2+/Zn2+ transport system ATPase subunit
MSQPAEVAVDARGVQVRFGSLVALEDLTVRIRRGRSVALIGPNGSGKTTLLHLLAGLRRPDAGTLTVTPGDGGRIAYVLQSQGRGAWMPLTALEVVRMGRYPRRGLFRPLRRGDHLVVAEMAARMEVDHLLHRQFGELSGGQRQRVRVAQALAQEPSLLLLDEPVTGLDLPSQDRILRLVDEERARGTTVILSTHALDEARHCDEVLLLAGRLVGVGTPDDVLRPELLREAYAGRLLGEHTGHAHDHELLVLDDPAHLHDH